MTMISARGRRSRLLAVAALLLVLAGLAGGSLLLSRGTGCAFAGDRCLRVLFIGNSYTSANDLPSMFASLVRSGGGAAEVRMIAPGGAFLSDQAASTDVAAAIAGTAWTAVVLQEQSMAPAARETRDGRMAPAAAALVTQIRQVGAQPYLLETWAHRDGWPERGLDRAGMQAAIDAAYREIGARTGSFVVPAGEAWDRALRDAPTVALWQADGSHPSMAGTYLAACVLYASITGRSPDGLVETAGLTPADAAILQRIAAVP